MGITLKMTDAALGMVAGAGIREHRDAQRKGFGVARGPAENASCPAQMKPSIVWRPDRERPGIRLA